MSIDFGTMLAQITFFVILFVIMYVILSFGFKRFRKPSQTQKRIEQLEREVQELKNKLDK